MLSDQLAQLETEIEESRRDLEKLVASSPDKKDEIDALTRKLSLKEGSYSSLLLLYDRARAAQGLRTQSLSVIEPATPSTTPSFPVRTSPWWPPAGMERP